MKMFQMQIGPYVVKSPYSDPAIVERLWGQFKETSLKGYTPEGYTQESLDGSKENPILPKADGVGFKFEDTVLFVYGDGKTFAFLTKEGLELLADKLGIEPPQEA